MGLSPMMTHYMSIKEKYPDCLIFYRLGDFYEMFFDDAKKASKLLELTLTGRDCGLSERAPMCGVPFHAADTYIAKLIEKGEKVAICEQLTLPGQGKELVERDVIRVVTKGTQIEAELLDESKNNYIACAVKTKSGYAVSWADITTGDFYVEEYVGEKAADRLTDALVRITPVEIIANAEMSEEAKTMAIVEHEVVPRFIPFKEYAFAAFSAEKALKEQFKVMSLSAYGLDDRKIAVIAAGALIEYLRETQKHSLKNISRISVEEDSDKLILDGNTIRNLELVSSMRDGKKYGTLLGLLDRTHTGMGSRTIRNNILEPLHDREKILYRQEGVAALYGNTLVRQGLEELLDSLCDIERMAGKISNNNVLPKDCLALGKSLSLMPSIVFQLSGLDCKILSDIRINLGKYDELAQMLVSAIIPGENGPVRDGGFIKEGYNAELDELINIRKNAGGVLEKLAERERERTGIKNLRVNYNRVFGYYIEVTNSYKNLVPYDYVRKQTLANAERYITPELKEIEEKILTAADKSLQLEIKLFEEIKAKLSEKISQFQRTAKSVACLDVLLSLAKVAKEHNYCRPDIVAAEGALEITDGRHPVVESISREPFVSNDTRIDTMENRMMILTGPNMAGKSTYMRQNALITLMAHIGSFVPAKSAQVPLTDRIFTRVGANDNLVFDQSTFMVEMTEVANILLHATSESLLILDEVGRGTSTFDGLSIAWAVVEYITANIKAKTLFATHYHELTELEGVIEGVKNYKITVKELNGTIVFLRKIMRGGANRSFGIEVASLAGVPLAVTDRAKIILSELERRDIAKHKVKPDTDKTEKIRSEAENIISELDMNNLTPMQAFEILSDLKQKVN